jgi:hypothetical protein
LLSGLRRYRVNDTMNNECRAVGGMRTGWGNQRNPILVPLCPSQIPYDLIWDRIRAAMMWSRQLTPELWYGLWHLVKYDRTFTHKARVHSPTSTISLLRGKNISYDCLMCAQMCSQSSKPLSIWTPLHIQTAFQTNFKQEHILHISTIPYIFIRSQMRSPPLGKTVILFFIQLKQEMLMINIF